MDLRADFSKRELVHTSEVAWAASPMAGVERRMLDRIGDEVARATTIVRYAPGSKFSAHTHTGGEEFIVLEGVFQDEHGDFPAGTYVRNPPTSRHTPGSENGCVIFVKLWQFDMEDREQVTINMHRRIAMLDEAKHGVTVLPLFSDTRENVSMQEWAPGVLVNMDLPGGGEFLVLDGGLEESGDTMRQHSWLRVPAGYKFQAIAGKQGAKIWIKTNHLPFAAAPET